MAREHVCESCGKTWRVEYPALLSVRLASCQDCGSFKFHLEPATHEKRLADAVKGTK